VPGTPVAAFHDDIEKIVNNAVLLRRIVPKFVQWSGLDSNGKPAVPGQGFQDYPEQVAIEEYNLPGACMSVAVEYILTEHGFNAAKVIEAFPGYGVASITAGAMRSLQGSPGVDWTQGVMWNPTDDEPWHAVVYCNKGGKKTGGMQSAIRATASWVIIPPQPTSSTEAA
jgi:hypothetical protein